MWDKISVIIIICHKICVIDIIDPPDIQDFNWDEQGYSMISRFYDDVAQLLDDKVLFKKHFQG